MAVVIVKTQQKQKSVRNGKRKENAARKSSTRNAWRLVVNAKRFRERGAFREKKSTAGQLPYDCFALLNLKLESSAFAFDFNPSEAWNFQPF